MMQILKDTNVDFMGKRKFWMSVSALAMVASLAVIFVRGINWGVEFNGGAELQVKYASRPDVGAVRASLEKAGIHNATVTRIGREAENEVYIRLGVTGTEKDAEATKGLMTRVREALRPPELQVRRNEGAVDLNEADASTLAQLVALAPGLDPQRAEALARGILEARAQDGVLGSLQALSKVPGMTPETMSFLESRTFVGPFAFRSQSFIGPMIGAELVKKTVIAVILSLIGMLIYIGFRFKVDMGVGAVLALVHDVIIVLGLFCLLGKEFSLAVVAAFLTLIGYTVDHAVVIFDRVRENRAAHPGVDVVTLFNKSINQTLSRTVLTSGLTWFTVMALWLFGGPALEPFSFVMVAGILIGTYSSIYLASPFVIAWQHLRERWGKSPRPAGKPAAASAAAPAPSRRATKVRKASQAR